MFIIANVSISEISFSIVKDDGSILSFFTVAISEHKTSDQYIIDIEQLFNSLVISTEKILYIVVFGAISKFESILRHFFFSYFKISPLILKQSDIPIAVKQDVSLGDLSVTSLLSAFIALKEYGSNLIIVNFESIITFSIIVDNQYIGFISYPKMNVAYDKLFTTTILANETLEGGICQKNTSSALHTGIFIGSLGAYDNIIQNIKSHFPRKKFEVIATNDIDNIMKYSSQVGHINQKLATLGALEIIKRKIVLQSS